MSAVAPATVAVVEPQLAPAPAPPLDPESREWLRCLRAEGATRDDAVARLHALLLRAALFEVARRRPMLPNLRGNELEDIATEAADDALMSVLRRLDDFRGASRFTTWVYKFALYEAAVKLRKRSWQGREVPLEPGALGEAALRSIPRIEQLVLLRPLGDVLPIIEAGGIFDYAKQAGMLKARARLASRTATRAAASSKSKRARWTSWNAMPPPSPGATSADERIHSRS